MAKKKTESSETPATPAEKKPAAAAKAEKPAAEKKAATAAAAPKATAAKAPAVKKAAAKKQPAPAAQPAGVPLIDTNLAAQAAAKMLLNRDVLDTANQGERKESGAFKSMKEQLAKPKTSGLGSLLGPVAGDKKASGHFFNQQRGHNQTQGGFNKTGVPRRTNG